MNEVATAWKIGDRVRINKTYPYGYHGDEGTIVEVPGQFAKPGNKEWLGVRFDASPKHIARWHRDYFDPA